MPELPEVETIRRGLEKAIVGLSVSNIRILNPKSFIGDPKGIIGREITAVSRKAKILIIEADKFLLIHLKMSGQLIFQNQDKYTRVIIDFDNGAQLCFNDMRKFGWIKVISKIKNQKSNPQIKNQKEQKLNIDKIIGFRLGPEPFSKEFSVNYLKNIFSRSGRPIKSVLMDQVKIAGIGNIYANEALFAAGILPGKPARRLSELEIRRLRKSVINVLKMGIKYRGSSSRDEAFRDIEGKKGMMQNYLKVYERAGNNCLVCGSLIKKTKINGRGTYFCLTCQS